MHTCVYLCTRKYNDHTVDTSDIGRSWNLASWKDKEINYNHCKINVSDQGKY